MIQNLNGRLVFTYGELKNEYKKQNKLRLKLSLLGVLMGIFLLPNLAYLSSITPEKLIELTNQEREAAGLNALTANQLLTQAAVKKGEAILKTQTFGHTINDRKFSSWVRDAGYNYSYTGENLAIDFVTSEGVMDAWNNSPLHKKNLLSPFYREIGISTASGKFQGQDTTVVVQIFGSPAIGLAGPLPQNYGTSYLNSNINFPDISLAGSQFSRPENLLTHSVLNSELPASYSGRLILPGENNSSAQANKFFIQPKFSPAVNNFIMIFSSLTLFYLVIFLYGHYFFKINKLTSI